MRKTTVLCDIGSVLEAVGRGMTRIFVYQCVLYNSDTGIFLHLFLVSRIAPFEQDGPKEWNEAASKFSIDFGVEMIKGEKYFF